MRTLIILTNERSISIVPLLGVFLLLFGSGPVRADEKAPKEKNVLIIGRSSLMPPLAQQLVGALLESNKTPMNVEEGPFGAKDLDRMLSSRRVWDYVIMDAWQFKRGGTDAPGFPDAVAAFVKQVRAHSPAVQNHPLPLVDSERAGRDERRRHESLSTLCGSGQAE